MLFKCSIFNIHQPSISTQINFFISSSLIPHRLPFWIACSKSASNSFFLFFQKQFCICSRYISAFSMYCNRKTLTFQIVVSFFTVKALIFSSLESVRTDGRLSFSFSSPLRMSILIWSTICSYMGTIRGSIDYNFHSLYPSFFS